MSDSSAAVAPVQASSAPSTPKKAAASKKKASATKLTKGKKTEAHPKYSEMTIEAIKALKDRSGSSRQAVLKYIMENYSVGHNKSIINAHLRLALRSAVDSGLLKNSTGTGASGKFKIMTAPKVGTASSAAKVVKKGRATAAQKVLKKKVTSGAKKPRVVKASKTPAKATLAKPKKAAPTKAAKVSKPRVAKPKTLMAAAAPKAPKLAKKAAPVPAKPKKAAAPKAKAAAKK